jgi:hypothetical protein
MEWFLVISLLASDEVLVKQVSSKAECVKLQSEFKKKMPKNIKNQIEYVSCEQGSVLESYKAQGDSPL